MKTIVFTESRNEHKTGNRNVWKKQNHFIPFKYF